MREHTTDKSYFDEYVGHYFEKQSHFTNHPWTFQRSGRDILSKIKEASDKTLGDIAESIGFDVISGQDSIFIQFITESFIRRNKLERDILIPCLGGANVRNWTVDWHGNRKGDSTYAIYTLDSLGEPIDIGTFPNDERFLRTHKEALEARPDGWQRQRTTLCAKKNTTASPNCLNAARHTSTNTAQSRRG